MSDGVVGERRWVGRVAVVAGLVVLGLVSGWALRTLMTPAPDVLAASGYTLVGARQGTVEHSLRLNTSAQWSPETVVPSQAIGVVTTIDLANGALARPGPRRGSRPLAGPCWTLRTVVPGLQIKSQSEISEISEIPRRRGRSL